MDQDGFCFHRKGLRQLVWMLLSKLCSSEGRDVPRIFAQHLANKRQALVFKPGLLVSFGNASQTCLRCMWSLTLLYGTDERMVGLSIPRLFLELTAVEIAFPGIIFQAVKDDIGGKKNGVWFLTRKWGALCEVEKILEHMKLFQMKQIPARSCALFGQACNDSSSAYEVETRQPSQLLNCWRLTFH